MIVPRKACKCAICTHEWLPSRSKHNPKADPRKVTRCASCKSCAWNVDDPRVIAERQAKAKVPDIQGDVFPIHGFITNYTGPTNFPVPGWSSHAGIERSVQPAIPTMPPWTKLADYPRSICKHRVLLAHCELCNQPQAVSA